MVDILAPAGPIRVALPLIKTILDTTKSLWQTLASLLPIAKRVERKYFVLSKGHEYLYTHPPPGSLVTAANDCERQSQQGPRQGRRMQNNWTSLGPLVPDRAVTPHQCERTEDGMLSLSGLPI